MGVGVSYTGVDGKITTFNSDSADSAFRRLKSIKGYDATPTDSVAANLASAWKKRSSRRQGKLSESGTQSTTLLAKDVKKLDVVTNVYRKDGEIVIERERGYVTTDGKFVPTNNSTKTIL